LRRADGGGYSFSRASGQCVSELPGHLLNRLKPVTLIFVDKNVEVADPVVVDVDTVISTAFGLVMTAFGVWLTIPANHNAKTLLSTNARQLCVWNCERGSTRSSV